MTSSCSMSAVQQEIYFRLMFSCLLSAGVSTLSLFSFACVGHIRLTYPWRWVTDTLWDVLSIGQLLSYTCNCLIVSSITILFYIRISVADRVARKYYQLGTNILWNSIQMLLLSAGLAGLDTLFVLHVLAPSKYASIFSDTQFFTFNQRAHCLVSYGAFMGFVSSVTLVIFNRLTLLYSHTPARLPEIVGEHTVQRALTTVGRVLYFIPLYALCPKPFCGLRQQRLPLLWLLLDIRMFLLLFVVGFHLQFSWSCALSILKWQFSKPLASSVSTIIKTPESALNVFYQSSTPIEKNLALERLADLVAIDPSARASVFSLNTLGGRPLLWRQISSWSTSVIEQFITKVHRANADVMSKTTSVAIPPFEVKYQDHLPASFRTQVRQRLGIGSVVQLTPRNALSCTDECPSLVDSLARRELGEAVNILCVRASKVASKLPLLQSLKSDIPYAITADLFAGPLEDVSTSTQVYTGGQSLIWAIEILACLTLASYTEDTYGSVQRSLGRILSLFADGLEVVERHLRLVGLLTKDVGSNVYPMPEDELSNSPGLSGELPASDSPVSARLTPYTNPVAACKAEDICNLSYYRLASDPTLPWRVYATLTWAATNCLRQFGDHLDSIQMSQKARQRLRLAAATRLASGQLNGSIQTHF